VPIPPVGSPGLIYYRPQDTHGFFGDEVDYVVAANTMQLAGLFTSPFQPPSSLAIGDIHWPVGGARMQLFEAGEMNGPNVALQEYQVIQHVFGYTLGLPAGKANGFRVVYRYLPEQNPVYKTGPINFD
jgi:hypothetical protein